MFLLAFAPHTTKSMYMISTTAMPSTPVANRTVYLRYWVIRMPNQTLITPATPIRWISCDMSGTLVSSIPIISRIPISFMYPATPATVCTVYRILYSFSRRFQLAIVTRSSTVFGLSGYRSRSLLFYNPFTRFNLLISTPTSGSTSFGLFIRIT